MSYERIRKPTFVFDREVERALGYTPCVCAVLDGTWHPHCYAGKTDEQIAAGYKRAFAAARRHLKARAGQTNTGGA
jgi:hypothetical protein